MICWSSTSLRCASCRVRSAPSSKMEAPSAARALCSRTPTVSLRPHALRRAPAQAAREALLWEPVPL